MIISNQIVTTFLARGGQAIAQHGQIAGSFLNIGRAARTSSSDVSLLEKQTRAFGTTIRYAFAGSVLFGMTSMIGKLNELQQQMGLLAAIAGPSGAVGMNRNWLAEMQDEIATKASDARTNVTDLNNAAINFLSTVQGADVGDIPEIVARIGQAARLSQTPTEDLTKAVTTLNIAAGRTNNIENINALLREWFQLISQAPGGVAAAPQIAQQLGPLASVAQLGRLKPEQLFGFSLGALRFGATPSVALRGTQYFLQSLFHPPSKEAQEAMQGAGFTPDLLEQVGGTEFARRYLNYVSGLGGRPTRGAVKRFGALADVMQNPDAAVGDEFAPNLNIPGLSPQAIAFLSTTLGRIHGIRTALVLLQQLNARPDLASLDQLFKSFDDLRNNVGKDADSLDKAIRDYQAATPLQGAAIALDSLRATVARDLQFALNPASRALSRVSGGLTEHTGLRHGLEIGAIAFMSAMGLRSILRSRGGGFSLPGAGLVSRLLGRGGAGIVGGMAARDIATGNMQLGATPLHPLYVTVVGQIFGGGGGAGGGPTPIPTPGPKGIPRTPFMFGVGATGMAAAFALTAVLASAGDTRAPDRTGADFFRYPEARRMWPTLFKNFAHPDSQVRKNFPGLFNKVLAADTPEELNKLELVLRRALKVEKDREGKMPADLLKAINFPTNFLQATGWSLSAGELVINLRITQPDGKVKEQRKPIPIQIAPYRRGKAPHVRGRHGAIKADFPVEVPPRTEGRPR